MTERIYHLNSNEFSSTQSTVWVTGPSSQSQVTQLRLWAFSPLPCLISLRHVSSNHLHFFPICPLPNVALSLHQLKTAVFLQALHQKQNAAACASFVLFAPKNYHNAPHPFFFFFFLGFRLEINVSINHEVIYEVTNFLSVVKSKFGSYLDIRASESPTRADLGNWKMKITCI